MQSLARLKLLLLKKKRKADSGETVTVSATKGKSPVPALHSEIQRAPFFIYQHHSSQELGT